MKKPGRKKRPSFFSPDGMVDNLHQALSRDFNSHILEYRELEDWQVMLRDRQLNTFRKKYSSETQDVKDLERKAFEKFLEVNKHMETTNESILSMLPSEDRVTSKTHHLHSVLLRARALMKFVLGNFSVEEWYLSCKNSTGATVGVPFSDTSIEAKLTYPISATSAVIPLFEEYLEWDRDLAHSIVNNNVGVVRHRYEQVEGSRATTVEKDDKIRRMICIEPTGNMYFQQGLMRMMYKRMESVGLSLESLPEEHKQRAMISSITGREATIDFSSASDCVSIELLRWLLPPDWFEVVHLVRSPKMNINSQWVSLHMISTMGNAVTFPLETLVFWTLAHATRLTRGQGNTLFPEWEELKCCSVFGDDCIVPTDMAASFIEVATLVGFRVNVDKSYIEPGPGFRESCGGDYLRGMPTRPYFVRAPTSTRKSSLEPWLYIVMNSLLKKYILYFGARDYIYKKELFGWFLGLCRQYSIKIKIVPDDYPDDSGLRISQDIRRFIDNYHPPLEKMAVNEHGQVSFLFCRFVYRKSVRRNDELRYAVLQKENALRSYLNHPKDGDGIFRHKFPHGITPEPPVHFKKRLVGGYVVAKGIYSCWSIPLGTAGA